MSQSNHAGVTTRTARSNFSLKPTGAPPASETTIRTSVSWAGIRVFPLEGEAFRSAKHKSRVCFFMGKGSGN